ncbi:transposase [Streptomyces sp. NPDC032198]|uniref:transposase n=1 Tax=Streptomyces sp. NPDC032198 TaxID=3155127 RepID=UPI00340D95B2
MPRRTRLTDRQGDRFRPLLPSSAGRRGRLWADHRRIAEVVVHRYRTGIPWRDLPAGFGAWKKTSRAALRPTFFRLQSSEGPCG